MARWLEVARRLEWLEWLEWLGLGVSGPPASELYSRLALRGPPSIQIDFAPEILGNRFKMEGEMAIMAPFWASIWASGAFRRRREIRSSHSWPPGGLPEGFLHKNGP